jgi:hypothetical protein
MCRSIWTGESNGAFAAVVNRSPDLPRYRPSGSSAHAAIKGPAIGDGAEVACWPICQLAFIGFRDCRAMYISDLAHNPISCPRPNSSRISTEIGRLDPDRGRSICHSRRHQNCQVRRPLLSNSNATALIVNLAVRRRLRSLFR